MSALRSGVAHRGEKNDLADRPPAAQEHHQSIDPEADPGGRRHPLFERRQEGLVDRLRLLELARAGVRAQLREALALLVGVVQLAEGVGDLDPPGVGLPALDEARLRAVGLGQR